MSNFTYRYTLAAGYSHDEPMLVPPKGTYRDMHLKDTRTA